MQILTLTYLEEALAVEDSAAKSARVLVAALVHGQMLCQIRLLREALVAGGPGAHEGPLTRMHAQVVEEVVPLAEEHVAVVEVALEDLDLAHGARVFVLEDAEAARLRHRLLDLDRAEVEVGAVLHAHPGAERDLLRELSVADIRVCNCD